MCYACKNSDVVKPKHVNPAPAGAVLTGTAHWRSSGAAAAEAAALRVSADGVSDPDYDQFAAFLMSGLRS